MRITLNELRRIIREASSSPARFYHGSSSELKPGMILGGRKFRSNFGDAEKLLEMFRPAEMSSRIDSVFLVSKPSDVYTAGGSADYIYLMEPIDEPQRHHGGWLGDMYNLAMDHADELTKKGPKLNRATMKLLMKEAEPIAQAYWSGKKHPGRGEVWEYLCKEARVVKEIKQR